MEWISTLYSLILQGFQNIANFLSSGLFDFFHSLVDYVYSFLEMTLYDIGRFLINIVQWLFNLIFGGLNFVGPVHTAWSNLSPEIRSSLVFFRIPEVVVIYTSALTVRLIRSLIPFF
ncbi:hypothetical protein MASR1M90_23770 [Desulfovibrionales bacterium]